MKLLSVIPLLAALSAPGEALSATIQPGRSVTLAWDASTDAGVAGYKIYYGVASRAYTNLVSVGNATTATISGLVEGVTYFFAATTYNGAGLESDYSNEASYTVPVTSVPVVNILRTLLDGQVVLQVTGVIGHTYQIQADRLVGGWVTIGTVTLDGSGTTEFTDVNAAILPALSYRLIEVVTTKLQLNILPNKHALLTAIGQVGHRYDIQATWLFKHWSVIGTGTVDASGSFQFVDTNAVNFPARFYRLSEVLPGLPKLQIRVNPAMQVVLTVTGQPGHLYDILATQNFSDWSVISSVGVGDRGSIEFVDYSAAAFPARYYRARERQ
ncbi:MAG: fibronectin type III domain-containing protein [Verrucomicrobia bacterium]|nr:fibronectin type III domain-containing protein [Verrucomicrobiota bacterium]